MGVLAVFAVLVSHPATADVVRHKTIPESFWGTWALGEGDCTQAGKSAIVLSAVSYASSDAKCAVLWVTETAGARGPIFSAHVQCSTTANGSRKAASNFLLLRKDASHISTGAGFESLTTYQLCPAPEPATAR
jgi:hypothetical protein